MQLRGLNSRCVVRGFALKAEGLVAVRYRVREDGLQGEDRESVKEQHKRSHLVIFQRCYLRFVKSNRGEAPPLNSTRLVTDSLAFNILRNSPFLQIHSAPTLLFFKKSLFLLYNSPRTFVILEHSG